MSIVKKYTRWLLLPGLSVAALLLFAAPALATAPAWRIDALSNTTAPPTSDPGAPTMVRYHVQLTNVGDASAGDVGPDGELGSGDDVPPLPNVLTATLPPGLTAVTSENLSGHFDCSGFGTSLVSCQMTSVLTTALGGHSTARFTLTAEVDPDALGSLTAYFEISGGGATDSASTVDPLIITASFPSFGIAAFDRRDAQGPGDEVSTQAAAHPFADITSIDFNTTGDSNLLIGDLRPVEPAKDVIVDLPPGFLGNPTAAPQCTAADLAHSVVFDSLPLCSPAAQVGTVRLRFNDLLANRTLWGPAPVFNLVPPPGVAARFGFNAYGSVVVLDAAIRGGSDYGVTVRSINTPEGLGIAGTTVTFWGDPADPIHTPERACPGKPAPFLTGLTCPAETGDVAFLRNPTSCTQPGEGLPTSLHIDSWFNPGAFSPDGSPALNHPSWESRTIVSHQAPGYPLPPGPSIFPEGYSGPSHWGEAVGIEECDQVPFEPEISVKATTKKADSPTGLEVDLSIPQQELSEPDAIAQSDLEKAVVTLPQGMSINPSQANGLGACTSSQIGLLGTGFEADFPIHFTDEPADCPDSSKIGMLSIQTPLLDHEVDGAIYLAKQDDNPFHSLLALYLVAEDPQSGTIIKLPGEVKVDPSTGQVTTIVDHDPQLPFESFHLEFFGGQRAALITPPTCGQKKAEAKLSPWARPEEAVELSSSFEISQGCAASEEAMLFSPKLSAGTVSPKAGATSPFILKLTRSDGEQRIASLDTTPPQGLSAYLAGVPYCPEAALGAARVASLTGAAEQASPSCPGASQIGTVDSAVGAGTLPFHTPGRVYLAGPYKKAPLSMAIFVPAVAGPFDLGDVLVRAAIEVNPETAQITVKSGPLPTILQGIPLDMRSIDVALDRPHFTVNPTSCDVMAVDATVRSTLGATATPSDRFQLLGCRDLPFKPKLGLRLKGKTHRSGHPALRAVLTMSPGGANLASSTVILPRTELLENAHIRTICTRVQFAAEECPRGSVYGHATAWTPLLGEPLSGPVYLRSNGGERELPDLVADLKGQIEITAVGYVDSVKERLRTRFATVPDTPLSKFVLSMQGGKKGLLANNTDLCRAKPRATALFDAHNGKTRNLAPLVAVKCGGKGSTKHRR